MSLGEDPMDAVSLRPEVATASSIRSFVKDGGYIELEYPR
jgi:hypothetical protein